MEIQFVHDYRNKLFMKTPQSSSYPPNTQSPGRVLRTLLVPILLSLSTLAQAEGLIFESPERQTAVLELFTSHGCSSCPPADAWLHKLVDHPGLWKQVIPLSLHVDYWDGLGWPDRFAHAKFSTRQKNYYNSGKLSAVYTPGFVLNGREWRDWFRLRNQSPSGLPEFPPGQTVGKLHLEVIPDEWAQVRFTPVKEYGPLHAHLAVLGFGLSSPIGGGENSGKTLKEDFVVLGVNDSAPAAGKTPSRWNIPWPKLRPATEADRHAVVVWISEGENPKPLQAVAGWLP